MCKCQNQSGFKVALREAYAETTPENKIAVWENPENKLIYKGSVKSAEARLKAGKIECYFIPKKKENEISFRIVDRPEPEAAKPKK